VTEPRLTVRNAPLFLALCALALGAYLRLDQFTVQVLIDDEWHAVHKLINSSPGQIAASFGWADYSIPLTLFYWLEASLFGLSELAMRWPMMVFGLLTLALLPLYVYRAIGPRPALLLCFLLAISPLLINYSRIARPYALTLLLGYCAYWAFYRYWLCDRRRGLYGAVYGVSAALSAWLHPISVVFVVSPLLVEAVAALLAIRKRGGETIIRLLILGVPSAVLIGVLIFPPLFLDPLAITGKTAVHTPDWSTLVGVWFIWLGTDSHVAALGAVVLMALGLPALWRNMVMTRAVLTGLLLTLAVVLYAQPAWVHHSPTLARYLLPAVPLLLLALAVGSVRIAHSLRGLTGRRHGLAELAICSVPIVTLALSSPLPTLLRAPNTNTAHSLYQFDYRNASNPTVEYQSRIPLSPFWSRLASLPKNSLAIAAAPWYFESYDWDAPRWERISGQRVLPGFLIGVCMQRRAGEPPYGGRFQLRNAAYLGQPDDLLDKGVDLVVLQKPYRQHRDGLSFVLGEDTQHCEASLRKRFGSPLHEDEFIVVFGVATGRRPPIDA